MSEKRKREFANLVQEKYDQAREIEGCVVRQQQRGKPIELVHLVDPMSDNKHAIRRQKLSHILETSAKGPIRTPITPGVGFIVNPQRLVVDNDGDVRLISSRDTHAMSEEGLRNTRESLERAEPFPVDTVGTISVANSIGTFEDSLAELLSSKPGTLQERAQALLRSGFISRRYCEIDWVEVDDEQFPELTNRFRVIRAKFTTDDFSVNGTLSNVIEPTRRNLSSDSVEIGLEFDSERFLSTLDGDLFGSEFDLSIEGHEAYIAASTPSGLTSLAPESLAQISEIVDAATLVPFRSK